MFVLSLNKKIFCCEILQVRAMIIILKFAKDSIPENIRRSIFFFFLEQALME